MKTPIIIAVIGIILILFCVFCYQGNNQWSSPWRNHARIDCLENGDHQWGFVEYKDLRVEASYAYFHLCDAWVFKCNHCGKKDMFGVNDFTDALRKAFKETTGVDFITQVIHKHEISGGFYYGPLDVNQPYTTITDCHFLVVCDDVEHHEAAILDVGAHHSTVMNCTLNMVAGTGIRIPNDPNEPLLELEYDDPNEVK